VWSQRLYQSNESEFVDFQDANVLKRLLSNIAICTPAHCWHWMGARDERDYGRIFAFGSNRRAHRLIFEFCFGPVPDGLVVRHKCDNPTCCNPYHLELGTHAENMRDKLRTGKPIGPRGELARTAKLANDNIPEIIRRYQNGEKSIDLAAEFKVSQSSIQRVVARKTWVDVAA
jgi:hypothetical protein